MHSWAHPSILCLQCLNLAMRAVLDLEQDNNHKTGLLVAAEHNGRWSSTFRRLNERAIYAFMTQKPAKEMDAMRVMSGIFGPAAVALILVSPALAQEAPSAPATPDAAQPEGAAPEGSAPANPHAMLPELTGGPLARRLPCTAIRCRAPRPRSPQPIRQLSHRCPHARVSRSSARILGSMASAIRRSA